MTHFRRDSQKRTHTHTRARARAHSHTHTHTHTHTGRRDSVLVIKDSGGHVFGAMIPFAWQKKENFYGTGEAFVFALSPRWIHYRFGVRV